MNVVLFFVAYFSLGVQLVQKDGSLLLLQVQTVTSF